MLLMQMMDRTKIQTLDEETLTSTEIMQKEILEKNKGGDQIQVLIPDPDPEKMWHCLLRTERQECDQATLY